MAKNFSPGKGRPQEIPHKTKYNQVTLKSIVVITSEKLRNELVLFGCNFFLTVCWNDCISFFFHEKVTFCFN